MFEVAMINDCAYVGETLLKYLPSDIKRRHIKRTRGLWSKTFGLACNIMRAKADVYHVHYLLQDCYIASILRKKPLIGHAHGSDLRQQLKSRKWGWIVRHNLKHCDKILVAQPTILEAAKKFNETAEYFPIPFDPEVFFPKRFIKDRIEKHVLLASAHDFHVKGTDKLLRALAAIQEPISIISIKSGRDFEKARRLTKEFGLKVNFIDKVPHEKMNKLYWQSDLVLGSLGVGQLDTVAIEAMACGRPVVHSVSKKFFPECPLEELKTIEKAKEIIHKLLINEKERNERVKKQLSYVNSVHAAPLLAKRLLEVYNEALLKRKKIDKI